MNYEQEQQFAAEVKRYVTEHLPLSQISDSELQQQIEDIVEQRIGAGYCSIEQRVSIVEQVYSSIRGFGLLDSIIKDDTITEVMINGPENVFIEQNGRLFKLDKQFESQRKLEDIIQRIVGLAGREVNQANPICDTRLPDGSRVNVVLPPIALCGPTVTIRKFSKTPMTIAKLIEYGSLTQEIADKLQMLVEAKYNIFISGGTGSGKTTFLNALSNYIPKDERVITIEDSAELQIEGIENLVSLETRNANASGAGQITIRDLIKSSLRMRPERIIVGEVRGGEALDMLQAMNTGHDGSLSTGHANSTEDMLSRLETMVLQGAAGLPLEAIRQQIANISHDLRTPLTSILGYLQLLEGDSLTVEERREYLGIVRGRAKALQSLITSFYDLSRLEGGEYPLSREKVDLYHVLSELVAEFYNDFEQSGFDMTVELAPGLPAVTADPAGVLRVFTNLIRNALEHGEGRMEIRLYQEGGQVVSRFSNETHALTAEDVPHVFDRFFTSDKMRTGRNTGLGLAIVKALAGQMDCRAEAALEGDMFAITLRWPVERR